MAAAAGVVDVFDVGFEAEEWGEGEFVESFGRAFGVFGEVGVVSGEIDVGGGEARSLSRFWRHAGPDDAGAKVVFEQADAGVGVAVLGEDRDATLVFGVFGMRSAEGLVGGGVEALGAGVVAAVEVVLLAGSIPETSTNAAGEIAGPFCAEFADDEVVAGAVE